MIQQGSRSTPEPSQRLARTPTSPDDPPAHWTPPFFKPTYAFLPSMNSLTWFSKHPNWGSRDGIARLVELGAELLRTSAERRVRMELDGGISENTITHLTSPSLLSHFGLHYLPAFKPLTRPPPPFYFSSQSSMAKLFTACVGALSLVADVEGQDLEFSRWVDKLYSPMVFRSLDNFERPNFAEVHLT
ncbi:hypothetical protein MNV49_002725 [Pseudohyphozyma bogoriensis]|nr:hypothetical protein MNV49_002725 [Pseudohyphozyma bogoriensis]